jgi:hypothetical protein
MGNPNKSYHQETFRGRDRWVADPDKFYPYRHDGLVFHTVMCLGVVMSLVS